MGMDRYLPQGYGQEKELQAGKSFPCSHAIQAQVDQHLTGFGSQETQGEFFSPRDQQSQLQEQQWMISNTFSPNIKWNQQNMDISNKQESRQHNQNKEIFPSVTPSDASSHEVASSLVKQCNPNSAGERLQFYNLSSPLQNLLNPFALNSQKYPKVRRFKEIKRPNQHCRKQPHHQIIPHAYKREGSPLPLPSPK